MKALVLALVSILSLAIAAMVVTSSASADHVGDTFNCDDFTYQADAQAHYRLHPTDQDGLDDDDDGIACESNPCPCDEDAVLLQTETPAPTGTPAPTPEAGAATPTPVSPAAAPLTGGQPAGGHGDLTVILILGAVLLGTGGLITGLVAFRGRPR